MPAFNAIGFFLNLVVLLPIALAVHHALPRVWAQKLVIISLGAYSLFVLAPRLALFYACFWVVVALLQQYLASIAAGVPRRWALAASLLLLLLPLVLWKLFPEAFTFYYNFLANAVIWQTLPSLGQFDIVKAVFIPVGLSFSTFRAIDLLVQTHIGVIARQRWIDVMLYGFFPPILVVGPVAEYKEISLGYDECKRVCVEDIREGCRRLLHGFVKIYLLAYPLSANTDLLSGLESTPVPMLWIRLALFTWYFYLNFAGFSDVAIGCARLMGFTLGENFHHPFLQTGPQQFWNNWHMSLTRFAQRNVFVPAGGYRARTQYRAVFATMMVIAMWHGLTVGMLIFGACHAAALILQRWLGVRARRMGTTPARSVWRSCWGGAGTFALVSLSFPLLVLHGSDISLFYLALIGVH